MKNFILQIISSITKWLKEIMHTDRQSSCLYVSEYIVQLNLVIRQPLWHFCYDISIYSAMTNVAYIWYFDLQEATPEAIMSAFG